MSSDVGVGERGRSPGGFRRLLAWAAAADPAVLRHCPSERLRFEVVGAAVLATASMAAISSLLALMIAVRVPVVAAAPVGLLWGLLILNIDRLLIVGMTRRRGRAANIVAALPRVLVAVVVGSVVAEPLMLQVFHREIQAQLIVNINTANARFATKLAADPRFARIPDLARRVNELQGIVDAGKTGLIEADPTVRRLDAEYRDLDKRYQAAYQDALCELDGRCASGKIGAGPVYQQKKQIADDLARQRAEVGERLVAARADAAARITAGSSGVQRNAQAELDQLRPDLQRLTQLRERELASFARTAGNSDGLLARVAALDDLRRRDHGAAAAYFLLMALVVIIELLPVIGRFVVLLGPPSAYEQVQQAWEEHEVRRARAGFLPGVDVDDLAGAIRSALSPQEPVAFRGRLLVAGTGVTAGEDATWRVVADEECRIIIVVATGASAYAAPTIAVGGAEVSVSERVLVASGRSADEVAVEVDLDLPFVDVDESRWIGSVRTTGDEVRYEAVLRVPADGDYDGRVSLYCAGRLVQALSLVLSSGAVEVSSSAAG